MRSETRGAVENAELLEAALTGLRRTPKELSPRFFYDARGSQLFAQITQLDAYYVGRIERQILRERGADIARWLKPGSVIFEPGAGDCEKVELLLAEAPAVRAYWAQDISGSALRAGTLRLSQRFGALAVRSLEGNFQKLSPRAVRGEDPGPICVFFPGSTLGNFERGEGVSLLERFRAIAGEDGQLLLGVDLVKERAVLERAYDDPEGVTAAFNRNLLVRLEREAGARLEIDAFRHEAVFNDAESRIEMWLRATRPTRIEIGGEAFDLGAGEGICTEHSHKYRKEELSELGQSAGFALEQMFTDPRGWFAVAAFSAC